MCYISFTREHLELRISQEIPVDDYIPAEFSADFKFHLHDILGDSSELAYVELTYADSAGQPLGKHHWYFGHYGRIRKNTEDGSPPKDSPIYRATVLRELRPFGEWNLGWQPYQLDIHEELEKYLIGVNQSEIAKIIISMECMAVANKGEVEMWARNIVLK
jgi:hypothetical protein